MLTTEQLARYAEVLFWGMEKARGTAYMPGDIILVRADIEALSLAEAVQTVLMKRDLHPVLRINAPSSLEKNYFQHATDRHLEFISPGEETLYQQANGLISLLAPDCITHLKDADPAKIAKSMQTRKKLRSILDEREAQGAFAWTLCLMPTVSLAENAGMSLEEYAAQIVAASYLHDEHPVQRWEEIFQKAQKVKDWLSALDVEHYHVQSEHTDLQVYPGEMRRWIGVSGHNIPSFELFISPDYRHTRGVYYADQASYRSGNLVRGITLRFDAGRAELVSAEEGEDFVRAQLAMDEGACRLGEFSLTDKRFSRIDRFMAHTLFDENFGGEHGNCHVAVGASYADTFAGEQRELTGLCKKELGFNDSALHWDLVNTEPKRVWAVGADGTRTLIYENGMFTLQDLS